MNGADQEPFRLEQFSAELDELISQYFEFQNESDKIQMVPKILLKILRVFKENSDKRDDIRGQVKGVLKFLSDIEKEPSNLHSALSSLSNQLEENENETDENARQIKNEREALGSIL